MAASIEGIVAGVRWDMHPAQSAWDWAEGRATGPETVLKVHAPEVGSVTSPVQRGIELWPRDLKFAGEPKRSQRSANSPVPLKSLLVSNACQGWPVCSVRMPLSCQPSSIWA